MNTSIQDTYHAQTLDGNMTVFFRNNMQHVGKLLVHVLYIGDSLTLFFIGGLHFSSQMFTTRPIARILKEGSQSNIIIVCIMQTNS